MCASAGVVRKKRKELENGRNIKVIRPSTGPERARGRTQPTMIACETLLRGRCHRWWARVVYVVRPRGQVHRHRPLRVPRVTNVSAAESKSGRHSGAAGGGSSGAQLAVYKTRAERNGVRFVLSTVRERARATTKHVQLRYNTHATHTRFQHVTSTCTMLSKITPVSRPAIFSYLQLHMRDVPRVYTLITAGNNIRVSRVKTIFCCYFSLSLQSFNRLSAV